MIDIEVIGVYGNPVTFSCVIDTGFTGFLSIPLLQAFPIGLVLATTTDITFGNGASETKLVCLGRARIDGTEQMGLIVVEDNSKQVLLGMDFLAKFGLKLIVCPTTGQIEVVPSQAAFTVTAASGATPVAPGLTSEATPAPPPTPTVP